MTKFNYGALLKNVVAGFIGGFMSIAGANTFFDTGINGAKAAAIAGLVAALRVIQEAFSPTSYLRAPVSDVAIAAAGGKK